MRLPRKNSVPLLASCLFRLKSQTFYASQGLYLITFVLILGLGSRKVSYLPAWLGDSLWASLVYLGWAVLLPRLNPKKLALLALLSSWMVEFSQLIQTPELVAFRSTTLGHLLLGQGFLVSDLLTYTVGIWAIYLITKHETST